MGYGPFMAEPYYGHRARLYQLDLYSDSTGKYYISVSNENKFEKLVSTLTNKRGKDFDGNFVISKSQLIPENQ